jgi:hypothetical protein
MGPSTSSGRKPKPARMAPGAGVEVVAAAVLKAGLDLAVTLQDGVIVRVVYVAELGL